MYSVNVRLLPPGLAGRDQSTECQHLLAHGPPQDEGRTLREQLRHGRASVDEVGGPPELSGP